MSRVAEKCKGDIIMEIRNRSWEVQLALVVVIVCSHQKLFP